MCKHGWTNRGPTWSKDSWRPKKQTRNPDSSRFEAPSPYYSGHLLLELTRKSGVLTRNEQKKMNDTKYGIAMSWPQSRTWAYGASSSHCLPSIHDNMINCQFSPVAHLARNAAIIRQNALRWATIVSSRLTRLLIPSGVATWEPPALAGKATSWIIRFVYKHEGNR